MKQVRFFLFWILVGAALLIELGVATWFYLDEAPESAKKNLDGKFKNLTELDTRARNVPQGVYDPENPQDIEKLTSLYLVNPRWKDKLLPNVQNYGKQIELIHQEMAARSDILHKAVADGKDLYAWDQAYKQQSAEVLERLKKAGANPPAIKFEQPETNKVLRDAAGLHTKGDTATSAEEHALYTKRLRILESLVEVIEKTRAEVKSNPALPAAPSLSQGDPQGVALTEVTWGDEPGASGSGGKKLSGETATYADSLPVQISLEGPASALMAVQAKIECLAKPLVVVTGGSLGNRGAWKANERKNKPFEPMVCKLGLLVLDFTKAKNLPADGPVATEGVNP